HTQFDSRSVEGELMDTLIHERSAFIDRILGYAWNPTRWDKNIALTAVGGYEWRELHTHSDIDLLILLKRGNTKNYQQNIELFLTFLWDIQLKIGQSVRTVKQCVQEAKADITVATKLMESRTLMGDPALRQLMASK